jgi:hypothetical protein
MYTAAIIKRNANITDKVFLGAFEANLVPSIPPPIPPGSLTTMHTGKILKTHRYDL